MGILIFLFKGSRQMEFTKLVDFKISWVVRIQMSPKILNIFEKLAGMRHTG